MNNKKESNLEKELNNNNYQDQQDLEEYYKLEGSKPATKERTEEKIPD